MSELVLSPDLSPLDEPATARAMDRCKKLLDEHHARAAARRRPCFKSSTTSPEPTHEHRDSIHARTDV